MVGCGNSSLSAEIYESGQTTAIVNTDVSSVVIDQMKKRFQHCDKMSWMLSDATNMPEFEEGSFESVFDKGTLDALCTDEGLAAQQRAQSLLKECMRVIAPNGHLLIVSLLQDQVLNALFAALPPSDHAWRLHKIKTPAKSTGLPPFLLSIRKTIVQKEKEKEKEKETPLVLNLDVTRPFVPTAQCLVRGIGLIPQLHIASWLRLRLWVERLPAVQIPEMLHDAAVNYSDRQAECVECRLAVPADKPTLAQLLQHASWQVTWIVRKDAILKAHPQLSSPATSAAAPAGGKGQRQHAQKSKKHRQKEKEQHPPELLCFLVPPADWRGRFYAATAGRAELLSATGRDGLLLVDGHASGMPAEEWRKSAEVSGEVKRCAVLLADILGCPEAAASHMPVATDEEAAGLQQLSWIEEYANATWLVQRAQSRNVRRLVRQGLESLEQSLMVVEQAGPGGLFLPVPRDVASGYAAAVVAFCLQSHPLATSKHLLLGLGGGSIPAALCAAGCSQVEVWDIDASLFDIARNYFDCRQWEESGQLRLREQDALALLVASGSVATPPYTTLLVDIDVNGTTSNDGISCPPAEFRSAAGVEMLLALVDVAVIMNIAGKEADRAAQALSQLARDTGHCACVEVVSISGEANAVIALWKDVGKRDKRILQTISPPLGERVMDALKAITSL